MTKITKIEPDYIKDSVVEIRYTTSYPSELILGIIFERLKGEFEVLKQGDEVNTFQIPNNSESVELRLEKQKKSILHDDEITVRLIPNGLVFNCLKGYLLWPKYFDKIKNVIGILNDSDVFDSFTRVGLRYINEYVDKKLEDIVNFQFQFGVAEVISDKYNFRTEFNLEDHLVILNLIKTTATPKGKDNPIVPVSFVDIDVIKQNIQVTEIEELFSIIDKAHSLEKHLFFENLLKGEFLQTLTIEKNG
ncbi:TIGR04255 family protein [Muricauda sp. TY007]|uniref:TIGR04255 family protein n=1 Tax=Allomuricauda sp. TY007 TaxID=2683200 RepID=UPI0013BF0367|nr:TIGR04255 family protein [Muricauda sp. TY007]NDV16774.1 TIGR04255 family protein [Muricauda sp. TY007]